MSVRPYGAGGGCVCVLVCKYHIIVYSTLDSVHARLGRAKPGGIVPVLEAKKNMLASRGPEVSSRRQPREPQNIETGSLGGWGEGY